MTHTVIPTILFPNTAKLETAIFLVNLSQSLSQMLDKNTVNTHTRVHVHLAGVAIGSHLLHFPDKLAQQRT